MAIDVKFSTETRSFTVNNNLELSSPYINFYIENPDFPIYLTDFEFGFDYTADDDVSDSYSTKDLQVRFKKSNDSFIRSFPISKIVGRDATLCFWTEFSDSLYEVQETFTYPRPIKPFPSSIWDEENYMWIAPVPLPEDHLKVDYWWDEEQMDWVINEPNITE